MTASCASFPWWGPKLVEHPGCCVPDFFCDTIALATRRAGMGKENDMGNALKYGIVALAIAALGMSAACDRKHKPVKTTQQVVNTGEDIVDEAEDIKENAEDRQDDREDRRD